MEDDDEVIENKIQAELDGTTDQQQQQQQDLLQSVEGVDKNTMLLKALESRYKLHQASDELELDAAVAATQ